MVPGAGHLTLTEISISFLIVCKPSHGFQRLSLKTQKNKFGKIIYYVAVLLKKKMLNFQTILLNLMHFAWPGVGKFDFIWQFFVAPGSGIWPSFWRLGSKPYPMPAPPPRLYVDRCVSNIGMWDMRVLEKITWYPSYFVLYFNSWTQCAANGPHLCLKIFLL